MSKYKQQSSKSRQKPLEGEALVKETCRRIRAAKGLWDAHRNAACRNEREKAIALYNQLDKAQKDKIPQQLRIWLRYRSEKYFGEHQTKPGSSYKAKPRSKQPSKTGQKKRSGKRKKRT
ncbi:MAG: Precorrin-3B methylase [Cyanobacteria bacterium J06560_2]